MKVRIYTVLEFTAQWKIDLPMWLVVSYRLASSFLHKFEFKIPLISAFHEIDAGAYWQNKIKNETENEKKFWYSLCPT